MHVTWAEALRVPLKTKPSELRVSPPVFLLTFTPETVAVNTAFSSGGESRAALELVKCPKIRG